MKKLDKENIDPKIFQLYDDYAHNKIERRQFIEGLSMFAVGGITVPALLSFLLPKYSEAVLVDQDDVRLSSDYIMYNSPMGGGEIRGLLSKPKKAEGSLPGIIIVHENRGLNPYIEDVARRAALEGYITLAPDALWPLGGYPGNDDDGRAMQKQRDKNEMLEDFIAAFEYLLDHEACSGKIGVVGFCFGGWISNMMATRLPNLSAAVPFYGSQPSKEETANIKSPLLIQYAEFDERVNDGWPEYEKALIENKVEYTSYVYLGVKHGFHNNSTPRFDLDAAELAWSRTMSFFEEKLK